MRYGRASAPSPPPLEGAMPVRVLVSLVLSMIAVAGLPASSSAAAGATFRNPVIDRDAPDPDVIAVDGWYYAYSTQSVTPSGPANIPVWRSRDLVRWTPLGDALPRLPAWADQAGVSWAPHVVQRN